MKIADMVVRAADPLDKTSAMSAVSDVISSGVLVDRASLPERAVLTAEVSDHIRQR